jgi:hypothetical protein
LRAENRFIAALALLIVVVAVRNAWAAFVNSPSAAPWDRGLLDRLQTTLMLLMAVLLVVLLGLLLDEVLILIGTSSIKLAKATLLITALLVCGLGAAFYLLRRFVGGDPSPRVFLMLRRQQQRLLEHLDNAPGSWMPIRLRPVGELEPNLVFSATVWETARGWYWRPDDAYALGRYHAWAANHLRTPSPALHSQRVSVFAGDSPYARRGMRTTRTTRRLWWIDAWRSHRDRPSSISDRDSPEFNAGLLHIAHDELRDAGLIAVVGLAPTPTSHTKENGADYLAGGVVGAEAGAFTRARKT